MGYFISAIKQSACAPCLTAPSRHTLGLVTSHPPHLIATQALPCAHQVLKQKMPTAQHMAELKSPATNEQVSPTTQRWLVKQQN